MTDEMRKLIDDEKQREREEPTATLPAKTDANAIIDAQRQKDFDAISKNEAFQKTSLDLNTREAYNVLRKKDNEIKDEELKREWEEYLLKKKKEEQDYRTELEKDLTRQEVRADIYAKKREIAIKRYGYLYSSGFVP